MTQKNSRSISRSSARPARPISNIKHGFLVTYEDGTEVQEKNNFWSERHQKVSATNWLDIDKDRIKTLQLFWKGKVRVSLCKEDCSPEKWWFSHTGSLQTSGDSRVVIVSRNIGYIREGRRYIYRVMEESGALMFDEQEEN